MNECWLCGHSITDPPEVIGRYRATHQRVAHRTCLVMLGELELQLAGGTAGPGPAPRQVPGRP